jgi:BirA family biotin operon repressor/biotin-[acetyl-CoA-carboxylase] ligase
MANDKCTMANDEWLSAEGIARGLNTHVLARRVVYYESVGSTNDVAKQLADAGEPEGTLVIADEQSAGRGRFGRAWIAPARSSILMSLVLRPPLQPQQSLRVTMAVALGVYDTIRAETGLDARTKWHNDILLRGKKCAGILAEAQIVGDALEYAVVGVGVNVNFAAASVAGIPGDATTLSDELGKPLPRAPLVQSLLKCIEQYYLRLCAGENLRAEWAARLATLHQRVRAQTPWGIEEGIAEDVDDDGTLLLRRVDGSLARLISGDVTFEG